MATFEPHAAIRSILVNSSGIHAIAGDRIYAGPRMPEGYEPASSGPAIHFFSRGGSSDKYIPLTSPSWQFKCFASTMEAAISLYQELRETLHSIDCSFTTYGKVLSCFEETTGQPMLDPDSGWPFVLSFFVSTHAS